MENQQRARTGNITDQAYLADHPNAIVDVDKAEIVARATKGFEESVARMGRIADATAEGDLSTLSAEDRAHGEVRLPIARDVSRLTRGPGRHDEEVVNPGTQEEKDAQGFATLARMAEERRVKALKRAESAYDRKAA